MFYFDEKLRDDLAPESMKSEEMLDARRDVSDYLHRLPREQQQTDVPPVWKRAFERDVIDNLRRLAENRCPFCERRDVALSPYRFRPPAHAVRADGSMDKASYLWLAMNWGNLYPICADCVPANRNFFPVEGRSTGPSDIYVAVYEHRKLPEMTETPILLRPGEYARPYQAFIVRMDGRITDFDSARAVLTIEHFNLNRQALVDLRASVIGDVVEQLTAGALPWQTSATNDAYGGQFGGMIFLLMRRVGEAIQQLGGRTLNLGLDTIENTFTKLITEKRFNDRLRAALDLLAREDQTAAGALAATARPTGDGRMVVEPRRKPARLDAPRIKSVQISNFKSLERLGFTMRDTLPDAVTAQSLTDETEEKPQAPCLLILGENATGKSSILEAIALTCMGQFLRDKLRDEKLVRPRRLALAPEYMGSAAGLPIGKTRVKVGFHDGSAATLTIPPSGAGLKVTWSDAVGEEEHPLVFAYGAHRLFGVDRQNDGSIRHVDSLFKDNRMLCDPEPWLLELADNDPQSLNEVVSALRHIIQIDGHFASIDPGVDEETGERHCFIKINKADGPVDAPNPINPFVLVQRLDIASSGYRALLALVCDVFRGLMETTKATAFEARRANAVVLVDEIEAHLHPRWKLQIVSGLRRALPRVSFILTSHDPLCVRGMLDGEVMMLNRFQNTGQVDSNLREVVERVDQFGNIEALTIEQLLTSDMFQLFSTDDRRMDQRLAEAADALGRNAVRAGAKASPEERARADSREKSDRAIIAELNRQISTALPYGTTEVSQLVQKAVAEYLSERRHRNTKENDVARERAKEAVRTYLKDLLE